AMTTAASLRSFTGDGAGAPGFEPGIAGPKPAALPLGYAPLRYVCRPWTGWRRPHGPSPYGLQVGVASDALALGHAPTQCSLSRRREPRAHPRSLVARAEEQDQRHDR